jgi:hypothetical protein
MHEHRRSRTFKPAPSASHNLWTTFAVIATLIGGTAASAATINFSGVNADGNPVSGSAEFTLDASADTVRVKLRNTTPTTRYAGELFTGIDFSLGGLVPSLVSDMGVQRAVESNGSFSDTAIAKNLSWKLVSLVGDTYQLNFNPNAKDAIIGPPTLGSYSDANGSIKGNPGHNPFAAQVAEFVLWVPTLEASTEVAVSVFRFGTGLAPAISTVPEPAAIPLLSFGLMVIGNMLRYSRATRLDQGTAHNSQ